ncbi:MAG: hypothetical protein AVDCRST_MAG68-4745 [uncultured Gemmatimonadetes bacterium]|uniref:Uncharacterized protein n=1 Tax=uncultured Gemmatimonadota bacterium TaxID=203437 RepID=A0A6J4MIZ6_9BACT|nr:MAG: hypothetical protein AVDCRST_MAG68-4745 [uncultured Gemmatimonadota bacterium]
MQRVVCQPPKMVKRGPPGKRPAPHPDPFPPLDLPAPPR